MKFPRSYIGCVIYTIADAEFKLWVDERVKARNKKIAEQNQLLIELDPELAQIFAESTAISTTK